MATRTLICPRLLVGGRLRGPGAVSIRDGRIAAVHAAPPPDGERLDGGLLTPGLVDLQLNGAAGVDLAAAAASADLGAWRRVAAHESRHGVTAFAPTFITAPLDELAGALRWSAQARGALAAEPVAQPLAPHVEGPFLSPARPGAHPVDHLRLPDARAIDELLAAGTPLVVTIAPELEGAAAAIDRLLAAGVHVSIGHSAATAAQTAAAADRGVRLVTHLFNAQSPLGHREPGLPGRALVDERLTCGLIADLVHVAPDAVRLAFAAAAGRIALVSDAVAATGMPPGPFRLGPVEAIAYADGPPRLADGTLAGAALHLDEAVRNVASLGIDPAAALEAATGVPAAAVGDGTRGRLEAGRRADLVWWDDELRVRGVWIGGEPVDLGADPPPRSSA